MNQSQFVHELMTHLFGWDYEYLSNADCSYELALGMIKEALKKDDLTGLIYTHTPEETK